MRNETLLSWTGLFQSSKLDFRLNKTLERIRFSSNQNIGEEESNFDEKNIEEVFNLCSTEQSCILIGITCYKIGTLVLQFRVNTSIIKIILPKTITLFLIRKKIWFSLRINIWQLNIPLEGYYVNQAREIHNFEHSL